MSTHQTECHDVAAREFLRVMHAGAKRNEAHAAGTHQHIAKPKQHEGNSFSYAE